MKQHSDLLALAAARRQKLFALLGDDVGAVVSCTNTNKGYLSGYHSMTHDIVPEYLSAVVATRDKAVLVTSASDAGPAYELLDDPDLIFRYGTFYFEASEAAGPLEFDLPGFPDFFAALGHALATVAPPNQRVGVDRSRGAMLDPIVAEICGASSAVDVTEAILRARRIKLPGEVELIRHATQLVEAGIEAILAGGRAGMTEFDFAALVTEKMVAGGGVPRLVSVTSGPRSALADAYPTFRKIAAGELIRLDASCFVGGFSSDMARTFVIGEPTKLSDTRYKAIAAGLEEELSRVRAGALVRDVFDGAVQTVRQQGIPSYRRHHCGHGLGLGGYEHPIIAENSDATLETGMCLCLETPYYQLGWGGMMVEDTILVTEHGYEPITTIPRKLFLI
jgi:Xaa-Pro dipeptidase